MSHMTLTFRDLHKYLLAACHDDANAMWAFGGISFIRPINQRLTKRLVGVNKGRFAQPSLDDCVKQFERSRDVFFLCVCVPSQDE